MNYWIFKCDPAKFRIEKRLKNSIDETSWQVNENEQFIGEGDLAFIWRAYRDVGILAVMRVTSKPYEFEELPHEIPYYTDKNNPDIGIRLRVKGTFEDRFELLRSDEIREDSRLKNISALTARRGTNFPLTEDQGKILIALVKKKRLGG